MTTVLARPATFATVAALGAAAAAVVRRHRAVQAVAPDLRRAAHYLPLVINTAPVRDLARRLYGPGIPEPIGVEVGTRTVPGSDGAPDVPVVTYAPADREPPSGALLWIHGGGYVIGTPAVEHEVCAHYARELGILVVGVDYRLAPEHPFPAALDDCYVALRWLHDEAAQLGVDPARIAVGGASAGGGLAAALAQRAHDLGEVPVALQVLTYPMLDDRTVLRRDHAGRGRILWTPASNRYGWTSYLGHPPGVAVPPSYAVPARRTDLSGLPPTWIGVGDLDLFHDEDVDYARRLEAAGIPVELRVEPGMYHAAERDHAGRVPAMADFRDAPIPLLRKHVGTS